MTFSCKNYDFDTDECKKLKGPCIPARRGCVLEGKVAVSDELRKRLAELEEEIARKKKSRKS